MCAFVAINKAPGVYIDEVQLPGVIAGVGTSTAAFVGPARSGELRTPVRLANWTEFLEEFGGPAGGSPYLTQPPVYVTHAVQGFFAEGGSDCWFVRIGTAKRAELPLKDRSGGGGNDTLVVTAKTEGTQGNAITVEAKDASIASTTLVQADATIANAANNEADVTQEADAKKFLPGDVIFLDDGTNNEEATVASVVGTVIGLEAPLQNTYAGGTLRIADLAAGSKRFRVASSTGIEPGSNIRLDDQGGTAEDAVVQSADAAGVVTVETGLTNTYSLATGGTPVDVKTLEFALVIGTTTFDKLSMDPRHSRYFAKVVDSDVATVKSVDPPNPTSPPDNMPLVAAAASLTGGADDDPGAALQDANAFKAGIDALRKIDEVTMLSVPDRTDQDVQAYMIDHCESMQDRFAILDPQPRATSAQIRTQRDALSSDRGFAALYYPQIVVSNPVAAGRLTIPPSGHVAGLYARVDNDRGVFKAPANESLRRALDLERRLADEDQGPLNEDGINVIRSFPGRGIRVWGARTIAPSDRTQWRYVNVRRLLLFIEESLQEGTQFVVFEPNEPALWAQVTRQVTDFLTRLWTEGALVGATADEAFRVRVDAELNPPSVRALGQLVIEVVVFPTTPAEFVVFRIIQQPGGPVVEE
jgi:uncharacterized protein